MVEFIFVSPVQAKVRYFNILLIGRYISIIVMSIVKISNKELLEQLQARLTLRTGRRLTQQEILDVCIRMGAEDIDTLIRFTSEAPTIDREKIARILKQRELLADVPYDSGSDSLGPDDQVVYR